VGAVIGVAWSVVLAALIGSSPPVVAAEIKIATADESATDWLSVWADINEESLRQDDAAPIPNGGQPGVEPTIEQPISERIADDETDVRLAQFQLPQPAPDGEAPSKQLPQRLTYEYTYGTESDITYRANPDLDDQVRDDFLIVTPQLNGSVTYRPSDWLETMLEMSMEREFPVREEAVVTLPGGELQYAETRRLSILVDQALVTFKSATDPLELTVGRKNFEDNRHWLYDASLDAALVSFKQGSFRAETSLSRENLWDLDLTSKVERDRINNYILYADYRGIEDINLGGYTIMRHDLDQMEGRALLMGLRSVGMVSENFSYWSELALLRGEDEGSRRFSGFGVDVGGTYRFRGLPFSPNVTLGYAFGSGDKNPDDDKNNEFRQTGLQSNEAKFAGVSEFLVYGEALDPELSNLEILTVGLGFRPAPNISTDFVFHRYQLDELAEELRNSALTALMNQDDTQLSKDVGSGFDIVIGWRNLFGVRRLGLDVRAGWFFPGKAFQIEEEGGSFRKADKGISMIAKLWW
jgi:alginate production protein